MRAGTSCKEGGPSDADAPQSKVWSVPSSLTLRVTLRGGGMSSARHFGLCLRDCGARLFLLHPSSTTAGRAPFGPKVVPIGQSFFGEFDPADFPPQIHPASFPSSFPCTGFRPGTRVWSVSVSVLHCRKSGLARLVYGRFFRRLSRLWQGQELGSPHLSSQEE